LNCPAIIGVFLVEHKKPCGKPKDLDARDGKGVKYVMNAVMYIEKDDETS